MTPSKGAKERTQVPDLHPRGSAETSEQAEVTEGIDTTEFQELPEDDAMAKAIAESIEEANRVEVESHRYDEWQTGDQEWKYDEEGPLISEIRLTGEVAQEFAEADPNFAIKTSNLALTHPYWRKSKGDGNCGWRAIAFSYFELLLRLGSLPLLEQEIARLQSMTPWFVDQYASTYDDFGEAAIDLMEIMKDQLKLEFEGRMTWLGERFTGEGEDGGMGVMAVVQYFRTLAMYTILHSRPLFEPFIDAPFQSYLDDLTRANTEIDEVGVRALFDVILKEPGMGLEVINLHRGVGEEVDVVSHMPEGALVHEEAIVRLLFRPGHYDIIYKDLPSALS